MSEKKYHFDKARNVTFDMAKAVKTLKITYSDAGQPIEERWYRIDGVTPILGEEPPKEYEYRLLYDFAVAFTSSMNEQVIAVAIGIFAVLQVLLVVPRYTLQWYTLNIVYWALALIGAWIYARLNNYGCMADAVSPHLVRREVESFVRYEASKKNLLSKLVYRLTYGKYPKLTKFWIPLAGIILTIVWLAVVL